MCDGTGDPAFLVDEDRLFSENELRLLVDARVERAKRGVDGTVRGDPSAHSAVGAPEPNRTVFIMLESTDDPRWGDEPPLGVERGPWLLTGEESNGDLWGGGWTLGSGNSVANYIPVRAGRLPAARETEGEHHRKSAYGAQRG